MNKIACFLISFFFLAQDRGFDIESRPLAPSMRVGSFRALIIGINDYEDKKIRKLMTPKWDSLVLEGLLREKYGFSDIVTLINEQATARNIDDEFRRLAKATKENDSLLVYYAGHGEEDEDFQGGWWIPYNAVLDDRTTYIENSTILNYINGIQARHILLVSDSCFAGTFFDWNTRSSKSVNSKEYYEERYKKASRWALVSGNKTTVLDNGGGDHSIFANQFLQVLRENDQDYLTTQEIYGEIEPYFNESILQQPACKILTALGDDGGSFVFFQDGFKEIDQIETQSKQDGKERSPAPGELLEERIENVSFRFRWAPAGSSSIGSPRSEKKRFPDERMREISFDSGFWIQETEVTQSQWIAIMASKPWEHRYKSVQGDNYPATYISWSEAQSFISKLNKLAGEFKYKLPSEKEWEYACRANSNRKFYFGDDHNQLNDYAWFRENSGGFPNKVGLKLSNNWNIADMHGNVREWCQDVYANNRDPRRVVSGCRIFRGGGWDDDSSMCRSAFRTCLPPESRSKSIGFRLLRTYDPSID